MMARIIIWSSLVLLPFLGLAQWSQPGDRYAFDFDGSASKVELANESLFDFTTSVVVELDIWFDNVTTGSFQGILAKRESGGNTVFAINFSPTTNTFQWYQNNGSGYKIHSLVLRTYFSAGQWYHLRLSFVENGANVDSEIIIDGGAPLTSTLTSTSIAGNTAPVTLGISHGTSEYFDGKLDNVKISGDGATVSYHRLDDGNGTTSTDRLGNADGTITTGSGGWYDKWTPPATLPTDYWAYYFAEDVDGDGNSGNNSGTYTTWVDLSGNGFDLNDTGTGASYSSNSLNGYGGLNFGSCNYAYHNSPGGTLTAISIAFVIKITDYQSGDLLPIVGLSDNGGSEAAWIEGDFFNGTIFWNVGFDTDTSIPVVFSGSPGNGTVIVAVGTLNYSTGECYLEVQNGNNQSDTVAPFGSDLDMSGSAYILLEPCSGDSYDYLEVQMFERALTSEEVDLLMDNLTTKYGL